MWSIIVHPPPAEWLLLFISAAAHWHRSPLSLLIFDLSLEEAAGGHVTTSPLLQHKKTTKKQPHFPWPAANCLRFLSSESNWENESFLPCVCMTSSKRVPKTEWVVVPLNCFNWVFAAAGVTRELSVTENKRVNEDQTQRGDVTHWDHSSTN